MSLASQQQGSGGYGGTSAKNAPPQEGLHVDRGEGGYQHVDGEDDEQHQEEELTIINQCKKIIFARRLNLLLLCVPIAFAVRYSSAFASAEAVTSAAEKGAEATGTMSTLAELSEVVVFLCSFLSLIPLAAALADLTEDVALRTSDAIGALVNVTFGNATELIISLAALRRKEYAIITNSLVGSVVGNMLLVLGASLFASGLKNPFTTYNSEAAQVYMSTLLLSGFLFLIPTLFSYINKGAADETNGPHYVLRISQQLSVVLVLVYALFIYFQLKTHSILFNEDESAANSKSNPSSPASVSDKKDASARNVENAVVLRRGNSTGDFSGTHHHHHGTRSRGASMINNNNNNGTVDNNSIVMNDPSYAAVPTVILAPEEADEDGDEEEPQFTLVFAIAATGFLAVLISFLSDMLVDTMTPAADAMGLGFHFTSIVLVPIAGNVAEHASAVMMALKGKADIAFGIALGSSIQIAMFAFPVTVIISYFWSLDFSMDLTPFVAGIMFASMLLAYVIVASGSSTYLTGVKLLVAYIGICSAMLNAPDI